MQTAGDYLKECREARNMSLSDIAQITKITKVYLEYLENNEYEKIPAKPYVKGYISSYAACMGADQHEVLKLYDYCQSENNDSTELISENLPGSGRSIPFFLRLNKKAGLVCAVGIFFILSIGLYYSFLQTQRGAVATKRQPEQPEAERTRLIPKIAYDSPPKKQDSIYYKSSQQNGFAKTIEPKEIQKKSNSGLSQLPNPVPNHQTTSVAEDALPDQAAEEIANANKSSISKIVAMPSEDDLKIVEAAACSNVKNRIPQGSGDSFEWSEDKIFIFTRIKCEKIPSSIRHIYYFKGEKVNDISLSVRSSHWRTWSYKTISNKRYIGPWRVDITSNDGKLLQSINFEII